MFSNKKGLLDHCNLIQGWQVNFSKIVTLKSELQPNWPNGLLKSFEDFMNISWFYLIKVKFSGHFWTYTLSAPSCTWFLMIGMLVGLNLFIICWVWIPLGPPVKFWTCFPTWASNRNLNFQEKLQNGLCSCTSWSNVWHTIEMFDTYPESSWYKLLENTRKSWNNQKSYFTILDKNTQKRILCAMTVDQ